MKHLMTLLAVTLLALPTPAASPLDNLKSGTVELKSAGPIAFGPDGILFVADPLAATVYAIATGDANATEASAVNVADLGAKLATKLDTPAGSVQVVDLAINPISHAPYLSVARGKGPDALPMLFKLDAKGTPTEVSLKDVKMAKVELTKAIEGKKRAEAITQIKFAKGKLYVAGLSSEEFASTLRVIDFPFAAEAPLTALEIYHGAHGRFETAAPIRTFTLLEIAGQSHLLAAYTCTPLVKIPVSELKPGSKVQGYTVAELGNHNKPLDMVTYTKDGKEYLLMANSARGVMKVALAGIDKAEAIKTRVADTKGLKYETIKELTGVVQLDRLDGERALVLTTDGKGFALKTIDLP